MKKVTMLSAVIASMFSVSALASNYSYNDETFKLDIGKSTVKVSQCDKAKKCDDATADVKALKATLEKRIGEYQKLLDDRKGVLKKVKKQVDAAESVIKDEKGKATYVMVNLGENFNLPIPEKDAKEGKFDIVFSAIEANVSRFKRVLDMLESGKAPKGFKAKDYGEIAPIMDMHNVVKFAKHL